MSAPPRSDFLRVLSERGFLHQCTDLEALDALAATERVTGYIGVDCTADSLHIGNLVGLMMLRWLQRTGHRPISLIGGGTTKVGDPSGKDESRRLLDEATLASNVAGVRRSVGKFLSFGDGPDDAITVNNDDWLAGLGYIPFLREYGPHFTINRMLTFDSVRLRLEREQPLTLLEFNYMVMQAYDFVELARRYDCRLQMGGSDQWGNIVNGVELGRRVAGLRLFGATSELITTASGEKMGKSVHGAVWLNEERLPPFDYFQFWRNTQDGDVGRFLRLFTELPLDEVARLETLAGAELNAAKETLAFEATRLCHGAAAADVALAAARRIFAGAGAGDRAGLPTVNVSAAELRAGITLVELLRRAGLAASNGEARRLLRGGGARLNDEKVTDETLLVTAAHAKDGEILLSAGRKRHVAVRPV